MQDWPEADMHFTQGIQRLTRIDTGEGLHVPLTDDRIYEYPWAYATQVGYWQVSDGEGKRRREYLLRGGCLVVAAVPGSPADADRRGRAAHGRGP